MRLKGISAEDYRWYVELREFGSVPHSGFGLGLERLVQFVTGLPNIREVIRFPDNAWSCRVLGILGKVF